MTQMVYGSRYEAGLDVMVGDGERKAVRMKVRSDQIELVHSKKA